MTTWLTIWFNPRSALRKQLMQNPHYALIFLAVTAGLLNGYGWIIYSWGRYPFADHLQRFNLILASLCGGVLYSVFHLYMMGWLYTWTGSWIGGQGSFTDLKCATGWSYFPFIISGLFSILKGIEFFPIEVQTGFGFLFIIFGIWGIIILFNLLAEAHQFSLGKAILTLFFSLMVLVVVVSVFALGTALYRFLMMIT